jgi:hypothetical protein
MNQKYKIFIFIAALLYVIYHLITLSYSPLPWYDEVSFASITEDFIQHHTFHPVAISISVPWENAMYGPLFFALQSAIVKVLGFNMFSIRISNLLFGFADIYLVYKICQYFEFKRQAIVVTVLLLTFDLSYNQFLHSGRMDFMTIFFFLSSFLVFKDIPAQPVKDTVVPALLTGVLLACAFLTTPRILFTFSFYCCYFVYELYENRHTYLKNVLIKYLLIAITFGTIFYVWIYLKFGGLGNYIYVNYTSNEMVQRHVGFKLNEIKPNEGMFFFAYAIVCIILLAINRQLYKNARLLLFTVPVIISFIVLVGGGFAGRYYAMVAPFTTLLVAGVSADVYSSNRLFRMINYGVIAALMLTFLVKAFYVFATLPDREPALHEQKIMQYIPARSTVAGDFEYYYFARRKNCYFQSLKENGLPNTVLKHYMTHNYDYFIFNKTNHELDIYKIWVLKNRYQLVATIDDQPRAPWLSQALSKLGFKITESYSCYIYKYIGGDNNAANH